MRIRHELTLFAAAACTAAALGACRAQPASDEEIAAAQQAEEAREAAEQAEQATERAAAAQVEPEVEPEVVEPERPAPPTLTYVDAGQRAATAAPRLQTARSLQQQPTLRPVITDTARLAPLDGRRLPTGAALRPVTAPVRLQAGTISGTPQDDSGDKIE